MTARIARRVLHLGPELDRGGQGVIRPALNLPDADGRPLVYKEYLPHAAAIVNAAVLDRLADLYNCGGADGDWLRERTAWPQQLVEEDGRITGVLMRAIPDDYRFMFNPGTSTPASPKLAQFAFLLNSDTYLRRSGLHITDQDRLLLLTDVASALDRFHRLGVTVGDFSPKNLLFCLGAPRRVFFLDCDSMRLEGADVLPQTHTPDWDLPPGEEPGTAAADLYKFGLLAIRLFARDQASRDPSALNDIAHRLGWLAANSLSPIPSQRPSVAAWLQTLCAIATPAPWTVPRPLAVVGPPPMVPLPRPRRKLGSIAALWASAVFAVGTLATFVMISEQTPHAMGNPSLISTTTTAVASPPGPQILHGACPIKPSSGADSRC